MSLKSMNLLIVDDRPENIITLEAVVKEYLPECNSFSAMNGKECLSVLEREKIDAALIDVQMPDISGLDLCGKIKSIPEHSLIPITLITAHCSDSFLRTDGLNLGAHDFISRPIDNIELIAKIRAMLRVKQTEDSLIEKKESLEELVNDKTLELEESESRIRRTLEEVLRPDGDLKELKFGDIVDISKIQGMLDNFYKLVNIPIAITDLKGEILIAAGWQDIAADHCTNSEKVNLFDEYGAALTQEIPKGEYKIYKCQNGLWNIARSLFIGDRHLANILMGQCVLEADASNKEYDGILADEYGFDEKRRFATYDEVPRCNKETIEIAMGFYSEMAKLISTLSYSNIKLARSMEQLKKHEKALSDSEAHMRTLINTIPDMVWLKDEQGVYISCNSTFEQFFGKKESELIGKKDYDLVDRELADFSRNNDRKAIESNEPSISEDVFTCHDGEYTAIFETVKTPMRNSDGTLLGVLGIARDISERKRAEVALLNSRMRELDVGYEIQNELLIGKKPEELCGASVSTCSIPTEKIGGDFYDFIQYDKSHFDLFVGDVMGKGISAALCGAATKTQFLRAVYDLMCSSNLPAIPTLEEIASYAQLQICEKLINLESFVTASLARFNLKKKRMDIVDCGHTATVHFRADSGKCDKIKGKHFPFGFCPDETYTQQTVHFKNGDIFCFYSDGVIETSNAEGKFFGIDRLIKLITENSDKSSDDLEKILVKELEDFSGEMKFSDDITFVFVKIEEVADSRSIVAKKSIFTSDIKKIEEIRNYVLTALAEVDDVQSSFVTMLSLAVTEAVANIIKHGYQSQPDKTIGVCVDVFSEKVEISLSHAGAPMKKRQLATPAFDGSHDTGYGLFLIRKSVDDIELNTNENGITELKLIKYFNET